MKHLRSSFSSACPAARVLLAVGLAGLSACGASRSADGEGAAPNPSEERLSVVGAGGGSTASGPSERAEVEQPLGSSPSVPGDDVGDGVREAAGGSSTDIPRDSGGDGLAAGGTGPAGNAGGSANVSGPGGADDTGVDDTGVDDTSADDTGSADDVAPSPAGAEQERVVTLAEGAFTTFTVGAGNVYVVDQDAAVLARVPTAGGALEPISPTLEILPHRLAVDDAGLYAALFQRPDHTELWRVPLDGGGFEAALGGVLLGEVRSVVALRAHAGSVVSLEARPTPSTVTRTISHADSATGVVPVGSVDLLFSNAFALGESAAYVVRGAEGVSDIVRVDLTSAEAASLVASAPDETLRDVAVAAGSVYFASTTRVGRVPGDADVAEAVTLAGTAAYRLVANADHVYFLTATNGGCSGGSQLYRVAATGGTAEHLVTESTPGCIANLAADADGVYWLTADGNQLRALPAR